jgi:predicted phage-related endonuclease
MNDFSVVEVGFNSAVRQALAQFREAKALEAQAKALKADSEAVLRLAIAGAKAGSIGGVVAFKLVNGSSRHADLKKLAEDYPAVYEAVVKKTDYDFVKVA